MASAPGGSSDDLNNFDDSTNPSDLFEKMMKQSTSSDGGDDDLLGNVSASKLLMSDPFEASEGSLGDLDMDDLESDDILKSSKNSSNNSINSGFHPVTAASLDSRNANVNTGNATWNNINPGMTASADGGMQMGNAAFGSQGSSQNATFSSISNQATMGFEGPAAAQSSSSELFGAAPLNLSLGMENQTSATMQRKTSRTSLLNAANKQPGSKMRSNMSDGMLARALKAKYNQTPYANSRLAGSGNSSTRLRNSISSVAIRNRISNNGLNRIGSRNGSALFGSQSQMSRLDEVERKGGKGGGQNATWGANSQRKPNSALFNALLGSKKNSIPDQQSAIPNPSSNPLLQNSSGSRSSIQDFLAKSRDQARSLSRQPSDASLSQQMGATVDVSSLLPPEHAARSKMDNTQSSGANVNMSTGEDSLLHQSCRLYPTTPAVIESAIQMDPAAVRKTNPQQGYGYPINIAIKNKANLDVLKLLIRAGPDILVQKDGNDGASSLGIAVALKSPADVVRLLLAGNNATASVQDRRANYPIHTAVSSGLSLEIVTLIVRAYPEGLKKRNFHGLTPLEISQRSTRCPEEVMHFLQTATFSGIEDGAQFIDNHKAPPQERTPKANEDEDFDMMMRTLNNL